MCLIFQLNEKKHGRQYQFIYLTGELVKSKDIVLENSNPVTLNISELPVGFYL